jgi:integrase
VDKDGAAVQQAYDLETRDRAVAKVKLRRLVKLNAPALPEQAAAAITVSEFAEQWLGRREALGIAAASYERRFLERVWGPAIGSLPLGDVTKAQIQDVLDDAATGKIRPKPRNADDEPERYSRQSVIHLRATLVRLFEAAWKDEHIPENRAAKTDVPDIEEETKARAILTDQEIGQVGAHAKVDAEIKLLLLLSRTVGGLRSGDLNALDWTAFSPGFETCSFVRRKTRKKRPKLQRSWCLRQSGRSWTYGTSGTGGPWPARSSRFGKASAPVRRRRPRT